MFELLDEIRRMRNDESPAVADGVSEGPTDVAPEPIAVPDEAPESKIEDEYGLPDDYTAPEDVADAEPSKDDKPAQETASDDAGEPDLSPEMEPYLEVARNIGLPNAEELAKTGALPGVLEYLNNVVLSNQAAAETGGQQEQPDSIHPQTMYELGLDANEFDPELVEKLNGLNAFYSDKFSKQEAAIAEMQRHFHAVQQASVEADRQRVREEINAIFSDAPAEFRRFIGEGETEKLDPSLQDARANVLETMAFLRDRYVKNGQPVPNKRSLMQEAVQREFVHNLSEIERERIVSQQKRATRTGVPRARAVKTVDEIDKVLSSGTRGLYDPVVDSMP